MNQESDANMIEPMPCAGCQVLRMRPVGRPECAFGVEYKQPGCLLRGEPRGAPLGADARQRNGSRRRG